MSKESGKPILASLLFLGLAAWAVFVPVDFKLMFYMNVMPGVLLVALGVAVIWRSRDG